MAKNDDLQKGVNDLFTTMPAKQENQTIEMVEQTITPATNTPPPIEKKPKKQLSFLVDAQLARKLKAKAFTEETTAVALFTEWLESL